jgi:hypothetical protein
MLKIPSAILFTTTTSVTIVTDVIKSVTIVTDVTTFVQVVTKCHSRGISGNSVVEPGAYKQGKAVFHDYDIVTDVVTSVTIVTECHDFCPDCDKCHSREIPTFRQVQHGILKIAQLNNSRVVKCAA